MNAAQYGTYKNIGEERGQHQTHRERRTPKERRGDDQEEDIVFRIVSWNCGGAKTDVDTKFQLSMGEERDNIPNIILWQETNITSEEVDMIAERLDGWVVATNHTVIGHKKGCTTLVAQGPALGPKGGQVYVIDETSNAMFDFKAIRVRQLLVINVYIHCARGGGGSVRDSIEGFMLQIMDSVQKHDGPILIAGDFNTPTAEDQDYLMEMMDTVGLSPILSEDGEVHPTHCGGNALDWIFYRGPSPAAPLTIDCEGRDHSILRTTFRIPTYKVTSREADEQYVRLNYAMLDAMSSDQKDVMRDAINEAARQASDLSEFQEEVKRIAYVFLGPAKKPKCAIPGAWFDKVVRRARQGFRSAAKRHNCEKTPQSKRTMQAAYRKMRRIIRRCRRRIQRDVARKLEDKRSSIWKHVTPKNGPPQQSKLAPESELCRDFWRDFFFDEDALDEITDVEDVEHLRQEMIITADDVLRGILMLKDKKAAGQDDIKLAIAKMANCPEFCGELARLYTVEANRSEPLPEWMRTGVGRLIYKKKGSTKDPGNYRLIILAPLFAKLYEKILELKGSEMIHDGTLRIAFEQGGFMVGRSTFDSVFLLESLRDAQIKSNSKMFVGFLDLNKAFDSVNHKRLLRVLEEQQAPEQWINALRNLLAKRKMTLYDHFFHMLRGTAQGSPLSPQLFILFINPLIERLKASRRGTRLADNQIIPGLVFADDICLTADSLEDLQEMLDICQTWAEEYGMSFNTGKSELMQLAGKIPDERPVALLAGKMMKWVPEYKYLGIPVFEGRRRRVPSSRLNMFKALFRIHEALGTRKKLPVLAQLQLAQATILNAALYPSAVVDTDYTDIDKFMARVLNRITGCQMRWTSTTFLRGELGIPPSKYMAHRRALTYLWHVERKAWFGNYLPFLRGPGPYSRLLNIARQYGIDASQVRDMPQEEWKTMTKRIVMERAARDVSENLAKLNLPGTEPRLQCRPYVRFGGHNAMYGVQYRWRMLRHRHPTLGINQAARQEIQWTDERHAIRLCGVCHRWHRPQPMHMGEALHCVLLVPEYLRDLRRQVFQAIMEDTGQDVTKVLLDAPSHGFYRHVDGICWENQTPEATKMLLDLMRRLIKHQDKKAKMGTRKLTQLIISYIQHKRAERWAQCRSDAQDMRGWDEMKSGHK